jgi:hypothetical protein
VAESMQYLPGDHLLLEDTERRIALRSYPIVYAVFLGDGPGHRGPAGIARDAQGDEMGSVTEVPSSPP